jgi:hypothetical protein
VHVDYAGDVVQSRLAAHSAIIVDPVALEQSTATLAACPGSA